MTRHSQIVDALVAMMALRTWRDALIKPLGFLTAIVAMATLAEYAVHRSFVLDALNRVAMAVITAAPFLAIVLYAITFLDRQQRKLGEQAATDPLTGLPNRRDFLDRASRHLSRRDRAPRGVILLIDADHFKRINDNWGHAVGDLCLKAIADRMRTTLRAGDYLARIGGEEFAAFLPDTDLATGSQIGSRLTAVIGVEPGKPAGKLTFTLSVGAAEVQEETSLDTAMQQADLALYQAKHNGRGRLVPWDGKDRTGKGRAA